MCESCVLSCSDSPSSSSSSFYLIKKNTQHEYVHASRRCYQRNVVTVTCSFRFFLLFFGSGFGVDETSYIILLFLFRIRLYKRKMKWPEGNRKKMILSKGINISETMTNKAILDRFLAWNLSTLWFVS